MFIQTYFEKKIQYKQNKFLEISLCKAPFTTSSRIILSFCLSHFEKDENGSTYEVTDKWKNFRLADIKTELGKKHAKQEKELDKIYKEKRKWNLKK